MKIQLIILVVCVVTTFALAQPRKTDNENQNEKEKRESYNQASINGNNKSIGKLIFLNETTTESSTRSNWVIRREQNARHVHLFKHAEFWPRRNISDSWPRRNISDSWPRRNISNSWPRRNISDSYSRLREHRLPYIYDWQRKLDRPMPAERLVGKKQYVCHHHKNRTTTTTTTTSSTPISEMEE